MLCLAWCDPVSREAKLESLISVEIITAVRVRPTLTELQQGAIVNYEGLTFWDHATRRHNSGDSE